MATPAGFEPATNRLAYHFGFRRRPEALRGLDCPFTLPREAGRVPAVQSLHLPRKGAWLGIATPLGRGFPEFDRFCSAGFPTRTPIEGGCSIQLSYGAMSGCMPNS